VKDKKWKHNLTHNAKEKPYETKQKIKWSDQARIHTPSNQHAQDF
jgi:hypothetical protein